LNQSILSRFWFVSIPLLIGALIAITWANYRFADQYPGGQDFLVYWVGTRALLVDGKTPYSDEVARQVETQVYGRPAGAGEKEYRVISPLYFVILYLPYALISDFTLARAVWMTTLEIALVGLALLSLRLARWKLGLWSLPFYLLFAVLWYHSLLPLITGDLVILIAFWIALTFLALRTGRDEVAGILLAFTTIKPNVILLILVFVVIWTLSSRRWATLFWMIASVAILSFILAFFIPDWPLQNLREIMSSAGYQAPGTPATVFSTLAPAAGKWIGWALSALVLLILLFEWFLARGKDFCWFLWTACLTLVVSQWSGVRTGPENFVVLFLPLELVFATLEERWGRTGHLMNWFFMLVLFIGPWALFLDTITSGDQLPQVPFLLFPLPLFLLVTLYWVRWWAIHPRHFLIDTLRESEALE
jgi:hypothetical protein